MGWLHTSFSSLFEWLALRRWASATISFALSMRADKSANASERVWDVFSCFSSCLLWRVRIKQKKKEKPYYSWYASTGSTKRRWLNCGGHRLVFPPLVFHCLSLLRRVWRRGTLSKRSNTTSRSAEKKLNCTTLELCKCTFKLLDFENHPWGSASKLLMCCNRSCFAKSCFWSNILCVVNLKGLRFMEISVPEQ